MKGALWVVLLAAIGVAAGAVTLHGQGPVWMTWDRAASAQLPAPSPATRTLPASPVAARSRLFEPGLLFRRQPPAASPTVAPPPPSRPSATVRPFARPPRLSPTTTATPGGVGPVDNTPPPRVAVLATKPGSGVTDLIIQPLDSTTPSPPVARFAHLVDTEVQGAVIPTTNSLLVIAGTERRKDPAFGASALLVGAGAETKQVVDRVYHGTRPLILDDGRAIVQRGVQGSEPTEADLEAGRMRVDHLTIEQIDLTVANTKVLSAFDGYIAFIAGALRHEVFVYRVGPDGADIIGIDADSGKERTIVRPLPPLARDFSVDAQSEALLFTDVDPATPGQWAAERLSVAPPAPAAPVVPPKSRVAVAGRIEHLERASHPALVPTAWVGRTVAVNKNFDGLQVVQAGRVPRSPFIGGVDVVREFFTAKNDTWALALHRTEGKLPEPIVIQASTMATQRLAVPPHARIDLAGMLQQEGPARPQIRRLDRAAAVRPITIAPNLFKRYVPPPEETANDEEPPR